MRNRTHCVLGLLLVILAAFMTSRASAEEVWRLAGTFNNWQPDSDEWALRPASDGRIILRRHMKPGEYEFKFVRNGDWGAGHLGASSQGGLEQPGDNIRVTFDDENLWTVVLDPQKRTWSNEAEGIDAFLLFARLRGTPRVGVPVEIDLSATLASRAWEITEVSMDADSYTGDDPLMWQPIDEENPRSLRITPQRPGRWALCIGGLEEGTGRRDEVCVWLDVRPSIVLLDSGRGVSTDFEPLAGSRQWAAIYQAQSARPTTLKIRNGFTGRTTAAVVHPVEEGETFALTYRPDLEQLTARPGLFTLEYGPEGHWLREEIARLDEGVIKHDSRRIDHLVPISEGLGLADVIAWTAPGAFESLSVQVSDGSAGGSLSVPMVAMEESQDGNLRWQARVILGAEEETSDSPATRSIHYTIIGAMPDGDGVTSGPHTVYLRPHFETPDWAKQAVWYQIFPERFRNGNPANDPVGDGVFLLPWNAPWHTLHEGEFEAWRQRVRAAGEDPDRWDREKTGEPGGRFYNVVWDRRYGGDLQGVLEQLDELENLGVTALYLNPVFEAPSMHKYDTTDFRHVDDNFGNADSVEATWSPPAGESLRDMDTWTWTQADRTLLALIDEAHDRGMKIILDGVFNHVGREHPAFIDVVRNGAESKYAGWFFAEFDDAGRLVAWQAWDGPNGFLPKFAQQADRSLVYPVHEHIFSVTQRWMDPNGDGDPSDGIDGWRLDVALDVGDPFWEQWYDLVKSINPEAYIVAEIWSDHESQGHLDGNHFDAQMHYPFAMAVLDWLGMQPEMSSDELGDRLRAVFDNDAPQTRLVQQNLYSSHDTDRLVSALYNRDRPNRNYDAGNRPQQGEPYREDRPDERAYGLARLAVVLQATYEGSPMIYYGDEVGMYGADDPSNRKPYPWDDLGDFGDDAADDELRDFYRRWFSLRAGSDTLQMGMTRHVETGWPDVFAFERRLNDEAILVVVNRGQVPFALSLISDDPAVRMVAVPRLGAELVHLRN